MTKRDKTDSESPKAYELSPTNHVSLLAQLAGTVDPKASYTSLIETYAKQSDPSKVFSSLLSAYPSYSTGFFRERSESEERLNQEITKLNQDLRKQKEALLAEKEKSGQIKQNADQLQATLAELRRKETLSFVLNRVHEDAQKPLLDSEEFRDKFLSSPSCNAYVMSVDIRRSTELMLKARKPELFAGFITTLCGRLRAVILQQNGVFDKFTGDGVLAFFPDFYTGEDAGYYAVAAADQCHRVFAEHYDSNRKCFDSVLKDVGLGIGIDYGPTHLVQLGDGLSVVGTPVVYASRMSGAQPGTTLLNQPAFEEVFGRFSAVCAFEETEFEAKHEGRHVAYRVTLNGKSFKPSEPGWKSFARIIKPTTSAASPQRA